MDGGLDLHSIQALANLVSPPQDDGDSDDDKPTGGSTYTKLGPGDIGPAPKSQSTEEPESSETKDPAKAKDIWADEEVIEGAAMDDLDDPRPQPDYEFIYKQAVHSEDMYLQMGNKTPATASCEELKVRISLPGTKGADIFLDVKKQFIDLRAPKYKLGLHLPHPVDHKSGKAQWDNTKETLTVTLKMTRDLDFINF